MDKNHRHLDRLSGDICHRTPPTTNTRVDHEPGTFTRYTGVDVSVSTSPPALVPSMQGSAYLHSGGYHYASPYRYPSHHTGVGDEFLSQHQTEPRSSASSDRILWRADTQSFAAGTSTISTLSDHQNLLYPRIATSSWGQFDSPLPPTTDRRRSLQHGFKETDPRLSVIIYDQPKPYVDPARLQKAEPWSLLNSRYRVSEHGQDPEAILWGSGGLDSVPKTLLSGTCDASVPSEHQEMSREAFDFDIENIMEGLPTSQGVQSEEQPPQQVPHGIDPCGNNFPSNRVAFQYRLDRAETPFDAEADATDDQQDNLLV